MWGPWMGPMGGFWWILPVIGLLVCLFFVIAVVRMVTGGCAMCLGSERHDGEETARLRRELETLREELKKQGVTR